MSNLTRKTKNVNKLECKTEIVGNKETDFLEKKKETQGKRRDGRRREDTESK